MNRYYCIILYPLRFRKFLCHITQIHFRQMEVHCFIFNNAWHLVTYCKWRWVCLYQSRTNIKNDNAQHLLTWEILYWIEIVLIMVHCAYLIINFSLFLLQGGIISFLETSRKIINCGNNSNRKNALKILASISKPRYLQLDRQSCIRHLCRGTRRICTFSLHFFTCFW